MPQLDDVAQGLRTALDRARRLAGSGAAFTSSPGVGRWSAAECLEHLNLTSRAYLPKLDAALERLRAEGARGAEPFRMELVARLLAWILAPPVRLRMPTTPNMQPRAIADPAAVLADFEQLQGRLLAWIESAHGYPLARARIVSPFSDKVGYNAWAALVLIEVHQRRHLWQAERAIESRR